MNDEFEQRGLRRVEPGAVDLPPHQWRSDRPKKREPIFGEGALPFAGEIVATAAVFGLLILVVWLGLYLKGETRDLLFGKPEARIEALPTRAEIEAEMKRRGLLP